MQGPAPEISVVIPTRLRETRLAFALEALSQQSLSSERFEVIVVRAPDGLGVPLAQAPSGLDFRFVAADRAGAGAQRNAGWREARAPLVAFTDDDCRPSPEWLERLLSYGRGPDTILQGRTEPDEDEVHLFHGFARSMEVTALDPWAPTCNIAYPKAWLERLEGFDEAFVGAWGEDTDLALRARATGAGQAYVPDALVWHAVHPRSFFGAAREALRRSNTPVILARHPGHRGALDKRFFVADTHALLLGGLFGALFLRRWPALAALAMVPYVRAYYDVGSMSLLGRIRFFAIFLPRRFAFEVIEIAGLAASSARHRSLVL